MIFNQLHLMGIAWEFPVDLRSLIMMKTVSDIVLPFGHFSFFGTYGKRWKEYSLQNELEFRS